MKVLLVGHEASRTGAPLVLLEWGRWLREQGHDVAFLLARGGPLLTGYAEVGPTKVVPAPLLRRRARPALALWLRRFRDFDQAWVNTIAIGRLGAALSELMPVITHVHELDHLVATYVEPAQLADALATTSRWVAVSPAVRQMLVGFGVAPDLISVVPGMARRIPDDVRTPTARDLGASGTMDWRKGSDAFLQVARLLRDESGVQLLWMGGDEGSGVFQGMRHDIARMDLPAVRLLGRVEDVGGFYDRLAVFLVTSREDPFPLVMLEAAAAGVPLVAFEGGGGAADFIADSGGGVTVPYLDVDAMAAAVRDLLHDDARRRELGARGREHVLAHHRPEQVFARLDAVLKEGVP